MAPWIETPCIQAIYTSSSDSREFSIRISTIPQPNSSNYVKEKTAFLSEVRSNTKALQEQMNSFLTQKMEEDKVGNITVTKDEEEEENYGEEKVEED